MFGWCILVCICVQGIILFSNKQFSQEMLPELMEKNQTIICFANLGKM
jgi:hypothetical protein